VTPAGPSTVPRPRSASAKLRHWDPDRGATALFAVLALSAYAYLMWKTRGNTFFYDEWRWLFQRRTGLDSVLGSYNSQMMLITSAAYQVLWRTVGLTHYWVWRALGIAVHVALVGTVFVYARRRLGAMAALLFCLPLLCLGYGFEDVLWPINAGFVAALALGIWSLLVLEHGQRPSNIGACALLVLALACSELALVFALATAVEVTWSDRSLRRCWVWLTPILLYAVWWAAYYEPTTMGSGLTGMPSFAASMAAAAIAGLFGLEPTWGQSLLVAAAILGLWQFSRTEFTPRAAAVIILAVSYWLLVAYGRSMNPNAARYVYVGAVLLVLIAIEALRSLRLRPAGLAIGALLAVFALAGNLGELNLGEGELRTGSQISRAELGALDLIKPTVSRALLIDPHYMPGMTAGEYFAAVQAFGSTPAATPAQILREPQTARQAADGLMLRADVIQIRGPDVTPLAAIGPPGVELSTGGRVMRSRHCLTFTPTVQPAELTLSLARPIEVINTGRSSLPLSVWRFGGESGASPLPGLPARRTVLISARRDPFPLPWSVRLSARRTVSACTMR
jgi:hypothetical protein